MMINEGKYRSPKWMRNFIDFEVNTGADVSGEKSKRQLRKEWDKKLDDVSKDLFSKFHSDVIKGNKNVSHLGSPMYWMTSSEKEKIVDRWRGDMSFWDKFDKWQKGIEEREKKRRENEKRKKQEQEKLKQEIQLLYIKLIKDWKSSPYLDKILTSRQSDGKVKLTYTFENGDILTMKGNKINYGTKVYTVGLFFRNKFVNALNKMIHRGRRRSNRGSTNNKYSSHPKGKLYQSLLDTITQREDQLRKMSKNDPDRKALENELKVVKSKLENLKSKYKFENLKYISSSFLKSFDKFNESNNNIEDSLIIPRDEQVKMIQDLNKDYKSGSLKINHKQYLRRFNRLKNINTISNQIKRWGASVSRVQKYRGVYQYNGKNFTVQLREDCCENCWWEVDIWEGDVDKRVYDHFNEFNQFDSKRDVLEALLSLDIELSK